MGVRASAEYHLEEALALALALAPLGCTRMYSDALGLGQTRSDMVKQGKKRVTSRWGVADEIFRLSRNAGEFVRFPVLGFRCRNHPPIRDLSL